MFKGIYTALVSPFKNGELDLASYEALLKDQMAKGVDGVVVNGTTAESPNLSEQEVLASIKKACEIFGDKKVIVGCGSNSTNKTIALANTIETQTSVAALLLVVPYYNKPTQDGLYAHFKAIHDATKTPIILYNVPGRTITSLSPETCAKLAKLERIKGLKDATGDMNYYKKARDLCGPEFSILSGDDATFAEFSLLGGDGCISVLAHVLPKQMQACYEKAKTKDTSAADDYKNYLLITDLLFNEPNPGPVKYALKKMGIISEDEMRLPLLKTTESLSKKIDAELERLKII